MEAESIEKSLPFGLSFDMSGQYFGKEHMSKVFSFVEFFRIFYHFLESVLFSETVLNLFDGDLTQVLFVFVLNISLEVLLSLIAFH